jgi:hypothetical protein
MAAAASSTQKPTDSESELSRRGVAGGFKFKSRRRPWPGPGPGPARATVTVTLKCRCTIAAVTVRLPLTRTRMRLGCHSEPETGACPGRDASNRASDSDSETRIPAPGLDSEAAAAAVQPNVITMQKPCTRPVDSEIRAQMAAVALGHESGSESAATGLTRRPTRGPRCRLMISGVFPSQLLSKCTFCEPEPELSPKASLEHEF